MTAVMLEAAAPLAEALETASRTVTPSGPTPDDIERAMVNALARHGGASRGDEIAALTEGQAHLRAILESLLSALTGQPAASPPPAPEPAPAPAPAPEPAPEADPEPAPRRALPTPQEPPPEASLPFEFDDNARPDWPTLLRAFDFPTDARDFEGFRALQRATRYAPVGELLQSAEDVLNMLASEGIYMDDVAVTAPDADAWRYFVEGERGPRTDPLAGIDGPAVFETTRALLKRDPVFRDTSLFFQRRFDNVLREFASHAYDRQLVALADTRSGRAFMLLAQLSGTFGTLPPEPEEEEDTPPAAPPLDDQSPKAENDT